MKLKELSEGKVEIDLMISSLTSGVTNKGAKYLSLQVQDNTGSMDAKYWNLSPEESDRYKAGMVCHFKGDIIKYNNALQLRVVSMEVLNPKELNVVEFVQSSSYTKKELMEKIGNVIYSIKNPIYKDIVNSLVKKHEADFYVYPAASTIHHNFVGGLATHVLGMLELAEDMASKYELLDRDLLVSGVILHDIGKISELSGPIATEYTLLGRLVGHISIMQGEVYEMSKELGYENSEEATLLRHMILSHHGEYEYGSPVKPMIPEAEILNYIDNIDARMNVMEKAFANVEKGCFTGKIFALEGRVMYKAKNK